MMHRVSTQKRLDSWWPSLVRPNKSIRHLILCAIGSIGEKPKKCCFLVITIAISTISTEFQCILLCSSWIVTESIIVHKEFFFAITIDWPDLVQLFCENRGRTIKWCQLCLIRTFSRCYFMKASRPENKKQHFVDLLWRTHTYYHSCLRSYLGSSGLRCETQVNGNEVSELFSEKNTVLFKKM